MSFTSKGTSEILVAGLQDQMFTIDVDKGTIIKQVFEMIKSSRSLAKLIDTYGRSIYENETKSLYLCCNTEGLGQYSRLDDFQYRQNLECPRLTYK